MQTKKIFGRATILTVTGIGERKEWLKEAALSIQREKEDGVSVLWFLCIRGNEELSPEVESIADVVLRMPLETHVSDARNALLSLVNSEYICTLDDDDVLVRGGLGHRISALDNQPELGWVGGHMQDMDAHGRMGEIWNQPAVTGEYDIGELVQLWNSPKNWFICISHSFLMRLDEVAKFDGWQKISQQDILLVCQISQVSKGLILPNPMIGYRRHESQISRSETELNIRIKASEFIFEQLAKI